MAEIVIVSRNAQLARMIELVLTPTGKSIKLAKSLPLRGGFSTAVLDGEYVSPQSAVELAREGRAVYLYKNEETVSDIMGGNLILLRRPFAEQRLFFEVSRIVNNEISDARRYEAQAVCDDFSAVTVNESEKSVTYGGETVGLSDKEMALLLCLMAHKGSSVSREAILSEVWQGRGSLNLCDVYIKYLRRKTDERFGIKTLYSVRNKGYMLK